MYGPLILVGTAGLVGWILAAWFWLRRDRPRPDGLAPESRVRQSDRLWDGRTGPVGYNTVLPGSRGPEGPLSAITQGVTDHPFKPGDPAMGWERQCSHVVSTYGANRHCGAPQEAHRP